MSSITVITQQNNNVNIESGNRQQVQQGTASVELKSGDTLKGTVVSVENGEQGKLATIDIGDGTISAKLSDGMGLREGQTLSFAVRTAGQGTTTITPLFENTSVDQSTLKALTAAGIEITNDTVQMVKEMMEANLPINKDALSEMNRNLVANPYTSVSTLVEMKSLNIPITENNIAQYENYKSYEHQVIRDMQEIIDELPATFNELSESGNGSAAVSLYGNILKLFGGQGSSEASVNEALSAEINSPEVEAQNSKIIISENGNSDISSPANNKDSDVKEANISPNREPFIINDRNSSFTDNLKNIGLSDKTVNDFVNLTRSGDSKQAQELLFKELANAYENAELSNPVEMASWKKLFASEDYNKLLKNTISQQWLIKPDDVQKKENIEQLYQRLGNQAKALADTVNSSALSGTKFGQAANNLSNNLDFMNQLNHMFQYIQLPLQMTGQNVHGDLFVYRNKHKKMSEDGSVSAVLHLDMENLGPVDVYVKMIDTKVTTNFYVADEDVIDLINDNIHILNERLEKRGYSMQVNLLLHDEMDGKDPAVDEMLSVSKKALISTASFDARA
jgi:hypothetical protein